MSGRLVGTILLTVVLVGCGGTVSSLDEAADATSAETSRFEMEYTITGGSAESNFTMRAAGAFDYPNERGVMKVSGEIPLIKDASWEEFRLIGKTGYGRWVVKGKMYWVKDVYTESSGDPIELLVPFPGSPTKPTDVLTRVLLASDESEELGKEDIRGTETTHYRAKVDLQKLVKQLPTKDGPKGEVEDPSVQRFIPVEVWIDNESRLRRITVEEKEGEGDDAGTMTMTVELFDYGVEVDVQPPPADETISQDEFDRLFSYGEGWTDVTESGEGDPAVSPEQVCEWAREELPAEDAEDVCADAKAEVQLRKKE